MADTAYLPDLEIRGSDRLDFPRHSLVVRVTHWITALSFLALLVSGILILIAHPRLYWGETGGVGAPSLIDLPIPFKIGYSGWGRYLHFPSAWVSVATGVVYLLAGLFTRHFSRNLLPGRTDLSWESIWRSILVDLRLKRPTEEESRTYNVLQRLAYLVTVFVLFPLIVLSGLAMSPAIASVFPALVNGFGGQQSARTIHFFVACLLVLFLFVHVVMVGLAGFTSRTRAMITGRITHE
jgi:thiosulfate reductase cytochrome b subunit